MNLTLFFFFSFISPSSLPTHMSGNYSLYAEQWKRTKEVPNAVLPQSVENGPERALSSLAF